MGRAHSSHPFVRNDIDRDHVMRLPHILRQVHFFKIYGRGRGLFFVWLFFEVVHSLMTEYKETCSHLVLMSQPHSNAQRIFGVCASAFCDIDF